MDRFEGESGKQTEWKTETIETDTALTVYWEKPERFLTGHRYILSVNGKKPGKRIRHIIHLTDWSRNGITKLRYTGWKTIPV